jgi:pimeloyl-ACP methyl ester carboxylesterase
MVMRETPHGVAAENWVVHPMRDSAFRSTLSPTAKERVMSTLTAERYARNQRVVPVDTSFREQLLSAMPMRERELKLAGVSTAVLEGGAGKPLVLLHGPGGYAAHYLRIIPDLVSSHQVIAPDLPGHGASRLDTGILDAERVIGWLGELIEKTCTSKPVLVGQALGGAIVTRFAIAHAQRIRGLVLVDSFGLRPFEPAPDFGLALHQFLGDPTEATHDALWRQCARDLETLRKQMGNRWQPLAAYNLERARDPNVQASLAMLMEQLAAPAIASVELASMAVPTSLIWGRYDRAVPLAVAEAASEHYGWPLHIVENAGADSPLEQPEAFVRALRTALAALDAKESSR